MAVAILDRTIESAENEATKKLQLNNAASFDNVSEEEQHNARIREVYAKLINPTAKIDDILGRTTEQPVQETRDIFANRPYLVENARADAEIFRADSPVNRRVLDIQPQMAAEQDSEEESEDLRPTQTTIQYRTAGAVTKTVEEGRIDNADAEKRAGFTKKEKIVIAVVVSIIVALFALIIINSAILSGINSELSSLQSSLTAVKASYASVSDEVNSMLSAALKDIENFALFRGLVK